MWIRKEEIKLYLFINVIIIYVENPKESTRKLVAVISEDIYRI